MMVLDDISLYDICFHFTSDTSSSSEDEEVHTNVVVPAPPIVPVTPSRPPKVKQITSKIPKPILQIKNFGGKKSQGHRQARRHENSSLIILNFSITTIIDFSVLFIKSCKRFR